MEGYEEGPNKVVIHHLSPYFGIGHTDVSSIRKVVKFDEEVVLNCKLGPLNLQIREIPLLNLTDIYGSSFRILSISFKLLFFCFSFIVFHLFLRPHS